MYISKVCFMVPINVELPFLQQTYLRENALYRKIFYEWAYTCFMFAIPFAILIVVNTMVIIAIHKSRKVHAKLNVYDGGARKQELAKEISTSIMLVAIVLAFLTCNTLVSLWRGFKLMIVKVFLGICSKYYGKIGSTGTLCHVCAVEQYACNDKCHH